ncbi:hypothetical protein BGZ94_004724, partial [Podila epigama]
KDDVEKLEKLVDSFCTRFKMQEFKMAIFVSLAGAIKRTSTSMSGATSTPRNGGRNGWGFVVNFDAMERDRASSSSSFNDDHRDSTDPEAGSLGSGAGGDDDYGDDIWHSQDTWSASQQNVHAQDTPTVAHSSRDKGKGRADGKNSSRRTRPEAHETTPADDVWGVNTIAQWPMANPTGNKETDSEDEPLDGITAYWAKDQNARDLLRSSTRGRRPKPASAMISRHVHHDTDSWGEAPQSAQSYDVDSYRSDVLIEQSKREFWSQNSKGEWFMLNESTTKKTTTVFATGDNNHDLASLSNPEIPVVDNWSVQGVGEYGESDENASDSDEVDGNTYRHGTSKSRSNNDHDNHGSRGYNDRSNNHGDSDEEEEEVHAAGVDVGVDAGADDENDDDDDDDGYIEDEHDNGWRGYGGLTQATDMPLDQGVSKRERVSSKISAPFKFDSGESVKHQRAPEPSTSLDRRQHRESPVEWLKEDQWKLPSSKRKEKSSSPSATDTKSQEDDPWEVESLPVKTSLPPSLPAERSTSKNKMDKSKLYNMDFGTAKPLDDPEQSVILPIEAVSSLPAGLLDDKEDLEIIGVKRDSNYKRNSINDDNINSSKPNSDKKNSDKSIINKTSSSSSRYSGNNGINNHNDVDEKLAVLEASFAEMHSGAPLAEESLLNLDIEDALEGSKTAPSLEKLSLYDAVEQSTVIPPPSSSYSLLLDIGEQDVSIPLKSDLFVKNAVPTTLASPSLLDDDALGLEVSRVEQLSEVKNVSDASEELSVGAELNAEPNDPPSTTEDKDTQPKNDPSSMLIDISTDEATPSVPSSQSSKPHFDFGLDTWMSMLAARNQKNHEESMDNSRRQWEALMEKQESDSKKLDEFIQRTSTTATTLTPTPEVGRKSKPKTTIPFTMMVRFETNEFGFQDIQVTE